METSPVWSESTVSKPATTTISVAKLETISVTATSARRTSATDEPPANMAIPAIVTSVPRLPEFGVTDWTPE